MKIPYRHTALLFIIIFSVHVFAQQRPAIVPIPHEFHYLNGTFNLTSSVSIELSEMHDSSVAIAVDELTSLLVARHVRIDRHAQRKILIGIPSHDPRIIKYCRQEKILDVQKWGSEGYSVLVMPTTIVIAAQTTTGLFYGVQSLKQMILAANSSLKAVKIIDHPSFRYRAIMDDVSRGPIPTVEYVKYQIRRFAEMKINMFLQYTEHIVKTKKHPEFAPDDGSYTIDELKELSDYASLYHVTFVGGFQSFGHFENILATPEYAHLGESGTLISPVLPESYRFLDDIYSEMIPAFTSPFFHIDCDETFDLGKEHSKSLVDSLGYDGVYLQHVLKLDSIVKRYGKRSIVWGDILLKYPGLITKLPKDMIVGSWNYDERDSYDDLILPFTNAGLDVFVTPGILNSYRLFPNLPQAVNNISGFARDGVKDHAIGILTTVWDDGGSAFFNNDWYGIAYAAEQSWNTKKLRLSDFEERLSGGIYERTGKTLLDAIHHLNEIKDLAATDDFSDRIFFQKILPDSGQLLKLPMDDWEEVLSVAKRINEDLTATSLRRFDDERMSVRFAARLYSFLADKRLILMQASDEYRKAETISESNPALSRRKVASVLSILDSLIEEEGEIRDMYESTWLKENHTYALDRVVKKFNMEIGELQNIHALIFRSLQKIDSAGNLLPLADVRLDIVPLHGTYFTEWLMTNPLPNVDSAHCSAIDYLSAMGGERNAIPKVSEEEYFDSTKYRWRRVSSDIADIVDLSERFPQLNTSGVVYGFATLEAPRPMTVTALIGCNDGFTIFCNGEKVCDLIGNGTTAIPDSFSTELHIRKGRNTIMIKSTQLSGNWGYSFKLKNVSIRHRKNRYKIVE